jgi:hypothetical protein
MADHDPDMIAVPRPQITTGPPDMTVDEATAAYLTEAAARVRTNRYWGSGVSACIASLLDGAATALRSPHASACDDLRPYIDVVFDGPPSYESGRFVEVEDPDGRSVRVGEWVERGDGLWALRLRGAS